MKLSVAAALFATMASASAQSLSGAAAKKIVSSARGLEQNAEADYSFLANYTVKMLSCKSGLDQAIIDEEGNSEYEAVLLRLCPTDGGCDSDLTAGCKNGFGDIMVGVSTFIEAYFEDQRDNMQWDDQFEVDKYAECAEYKAEEGNYQVEVDEDAVFYIGPTCTEDNTSIRLALFSDQYCTEFSPYSFNDISGWTLPFSEGGLVSTSCNDCMEYNDRGELELREMCSRSYENAVYKCETNMETYSYYGKNEQGCEAITATFPQPASSGGNGGKVFGWVVLGLVVVGLVGYVAWWRKKKASSGIE